MPKHHAIQIVTRMALICFVTVGCSEVPPPTTNDNEAASIGQVGTDSPSDADRQILQSLHEKNLEEIAVGLMAKERGDSAAVRTFGERLIEEHTANDEDLKELATSLGISLSEPTEKSSAEATLEPLHGAEFDARFASSRREGFSSLVRNVEKSQAQARNGQVREFLARTLPVLRLQLAQGHTGQGGYNSRGESHEPMTPPGGN